MKISKLFHWLYGVIMLLPIFAIITTTLVSTFNMSAKEESEIIYKYKTNEVNSVNDLIDGNIYHFTYTDAISETCRIGVKEYFINDELLISDLGNQNDAYDLSIRFNTFNVPYFFFYAYETTGSTDRRLICFNTEFDFVFDLSFSTGLDYCYQFISICENIPIENVETHNLDTQEVFYRAIDKVQQSPLFNWAYNSFLVTPFAYIVNLFSMPTNSFVVMLLSYWLAISIIWLVFDLVMYIPLLVHRWLDKGVLE